MSNLFESIASGAGFLATHDAHEEKLAEKTAAATPAQSGLNQQPKPGLEQRMAQLGATLGHHPRI